MGENSEYLNMISGVAVPACQACFSGVLVAFCSGGVAAMGNHMGVIDLPVLGVSVAVGALAALFEWRQAVDTWRGYLFPADYQEPEYIEPEYIPPVRVELSENEGRSMQYIDLPAEPDQLIALGAGLVQGASFTESSWTGSGKAFSRSQFVGLRDAMVRRGLAAWVSQVDNARGVRVTSKGMAVMRHFASMAADDPPTLQTIR